MENSEEETIKFLKRVSYKEISDILNEIYRNHNYRFNPSKLKLAAENAMIHSGWTYEELAAEYWKNVNNSINA